MTENNREYETIFILDPTLDEGREQEEIDRVVKLVEELGGQMDEVVRWGRRRLAYEIRKKRDGVYTVLRYRAPAETTKELQRRTRLNEAILRLLTVLVDPRQKKAIEAARVAEEAAAKAAAETEAAAAAPTEATADYMGSSSAGASGDAIGKTTGAPIPAETTPSDSDSGLGSDSASDEEKTVTTAPSAGEDDNAP